MRALFWALVALLAFTFVVLPLARLAIRTAGLL